MLRVVYCLLGPKILVTPLVSVVTASVVVREEVAMIVVPSGTVVAMVVGSLGTSVVTLTALMLVDISHN